MKILFHAPNKTAAAGMEFLAELAQKRSSDVLLLLEVTFDVQAKIATIDLCDRNKKFHRAFRGLLVRVLPQGVKEFIKHFRDLEKFTEAREERWISSYGRKKKRITSIIKNFSPDAVYVYGDRHDGYEPALIQVAKEKNIPVVIPPIAFATDHEGLLRYRRRSKEVLLAHDVTKIKHFKIENSTQWVHDDSTGRDISYYPLWMVNARKQCDVLPENPWSLGGGYSDFVCVGGERERQRFLRNGVSPHKIRITGRLEDDQIYSQFIRRAEIRSQITSKYFAEENQILLIALPQLAEHNIASESEHWNIQYAICDAAQKMGWNVLISLHPKMDKNKYSKILKKYDFHILDERLRDVMPVADIFLVGQGSSTATWAVLCEVPLVIMDWYGLNYSMYDWIDGKVIIKNAHDLEPTLLELSKNEQLREMMRAQHQKQKNSVSPFDGKSVDRILSSAKISNQDSSINEYANS